MESTFTSDQVKGIPLDRALGAFVLQIAADAKNDNPNWISTSGTNDSSTLTVLVVFALILMCSFYCLPK